MVATDHGTFYIDGEARERYCFWLVQLVGAGAVRVDEPALATVRVAAEEHTVQRFAAGMRAWALATLAAGGYGFGQYEVSMGVLEDDGEPDDRYGHRTISWDGEHELLPASA